LARLGHAECKMSNDTQRQNVVFGNRFEKSIGFSRAVRVGGSIAVSGTAPIAEDGSVACPGDIYGQTKRCFEIILSAVERAGGSKATVMRTRVFMKDVERWEEAAKAHGELFADVQPACTFVEVSRFINPDWLVEIEADAYVGEE
jgi:enamine deaminase RidA (YjgF/YER057c/UK114 family)